MNFEIFLPKDWSSCSPYLSYYKVDITNLEHLPSEVLSVKHQLRSIGNLEKIYRIENHLKYLQYQLKKKEMQSDTSAVYERILYHVTSSGRLDVICENNLDFRRVTRSKFGYGVSFSPDVDYANKYSGANLNNYNQRVIFVCKVLYFNETSGGELTRVPPLGYDTTTGNNGKVYVKYEDSSFYPMYAFSLVNCPKVAFGGRRRYNDFDYDDYNDYNDYVGYDYDDYDSD